MHSINLYWYKNKQGENFGDILSKYLIENIAHCKVSYVPIPASKSRIVVRGIRLFFKRQLPLKDIIPLFRSLFIKNYVISIGSILGWACSKNAIVWGSGILNFDDTIQLADFRCVRGRYSIQRLCELNLQPPIAIGDPALLLPLILKKEEHKNNMYKLGIIPHYNHYNKIKSMVSNDVLVINLFDEIATIVSQINSCEKTICTSLHGIIVSHAYEIPSLWYKYTDIPIGGDDIKFLDYFSSVNIREYSPFRLDEKSIRVEDVECVFKNHTNQTKINSDLLQVQIAILESAPFEIRNPQILSIIKK